jgi:hypothetical protein
MNDRNMQVVLLVWTAAIMDEIPAEYQEALAQYCLPVQFKTLGSQLLLTGNHQEQDRTIHFFLCWLFSFDDTSGLSSTELQGTSRHGQQEARAMYSIVAKP